MKAKHIFILLSISVPVVFILLAIVWPGILWSFILITPLIIVGYSDLLQKKQTIKRNFPVIGHLRYLLEKVRPEIMQYFVETDTEGRPVNRIFRNIVYQRAKKVNDTAPFGTQMDVYEAGYEWMNHSIYAHETINIGKEPRVIIGGPDCLQPYSASLLNISAMSYGALSMNAILALNKGARLGEFAHNTGEGGISTYHLENGGDLIWQIGTGYFGCRNEAGYFDDNKFKKSAAIGSVKMIELKISQGAKPGHGGILPASKNTPEIALIRGINPYTDVFSPPCHTAFSNSTELMHFIVKLRRLSGGKPVGFKLCIGKKDEFIDICKAMLATGVKPDFITIDGGEGGTGAAPVEFTNSIGMPLQDGLAFAHDMLTGYNLKKDIKLIAAGKIFTAFHMVKTMALGADLCNSARGMMLALGCIQALQCNTNKCPVGVATQDKSLMKGLDPENKAVRVYNYHKATLHNFVELLAAAGINRADGLSRNHINRRVTMTQVMTYQEIYPGLKTGELLTHDPLQQQLKTTIL